MINWIIERIVKRIARQADLKLTTHRPVAGKPELEVTLKVLFRGEQVLTKTWKVKI